MRETLTDLYRHQAWADAELCARVPGVPASADG